MQWVYRKIGGGVLIGAVSEWVLGLRQPIVIKEIVATINAMLPTHNELLGSERQTIGSYAHRPQPANGNASTRLDVPSGAKLIHLLCSVLVRRQFIHVLPFRV